MMWRDSCRWVQTRLPLHVGGDLIGPERRRAERHLIACPACRARLEAHRAALDALRVLNAEPVAGPLPSLWPALARQIREARRVPPTRATSWPRLAAWVGLGMAAALLLAVGISPPVQRTIRGLHVVFEPPKVRLLVGQWKHRPFRFAPPRRALPPREASDFDRRDPAPRPRPHAEIAHHSRPTPDEPRPADLTH